MNRRNFLQLAAAGVLTSAMGEADASPFLPPWTPGTLDIHHLAYGRGNSTLILCPDGTTLLIDAGTTEDPLALSCAQKPNASVRPGEWIAAYLLRHMQPAGRRELDFALLTHIHPDHIGDLGPENPASPEGNYRLTGIMDVAERVPIRRLIDRGFPDYAWPQPQEAPFALNYIAYVRARQRLGQKTERFQPGSARQIDLQREPARHAGFTIRNLAANGELWTGAALRRCFPELGTLAPADFPTENMCSAAIRLSYGRFRYFTGGDLTCDTQDGTAPWRDIETPVAEACGPVDVAVADHHAYFDAVGEGFVRALRPRVFVIPAWYVAHPATLPLVRMLSQRLYAGPREICATNVMEANRLVNHQFMGRLRSLDGHIIIRVAPGGESFRLIVTDNSDDADRVKLIAGPYSCGPKPTPA